ncbi:D-alanine--D-alanine ligase [Desulfovibrio mangrovi]|uniref:D-alanine--D-alanine ligase n=1 Tax=Desulfovibrio mangrovi TaxID=2976983 RepID=UPI002245E07E|nr:D-alanine--D-alanine ligase [Desulfovibrio mangrovi]UZP67074.1 D-alanine--D-alanine ligase [Desulfovibrio mangrovi]
MRAAVIHNALNGMRPDQEDTLVQAHAVHEALVSLGIGSSILSMSLDLEAARNELAALSPDIIFNLVEELADDIRLAPLAPSLFAHMHLPFTGSDGQALTLSGDKVLCKRILDAAGIASPAWVLPDGTFGGMGGGEGGASFVTGRYLCKSVHEHASLGLDENCLVEAACVQDVTERLAACAAKHGGHWFAEQYVDGREFNIAIIAGEDGAAPQVLPFAEIEFLDFGPDKPKIVGYAAKWDEDCFEYRNTVRRFVFPESDAPLLAMLEKATKACWQAFGLAGYARIDYRVDGDGSAEHPFTAYVIDVNANPCIAPDAGLAAAAQRAGMDYAALIRRVVRAGLAGRKQNFE